MREELIEISFSSCLNWPYCAHAAAMSKLSMYSYYVQTEHTALVQLLCSNWAYCAHTATLLLLKLSILRSCSYYVQTGHTNMRCDIIWAWKGKTIKNNVNESPKFYVDTSKYLTLKLPTLISPSHGFRSLRANFMCISFGTFLQPPVPNISI